MPFRPMVNSFGQMTEVKRQLYSGGAWGTLTTVALYYYDANGARAKTDESGTIFRYVYSGHDPIYYNGSDAKGYKDIYLGGRQELRIVSPSEKWAYIADALGSTRKVLQNGRPGSATFSAVTYKPFGPVVTATGSDMFTYAGEMQDSPTGLVYLFARYYDPELGRFYALDPELGKVSRPQTVNRYVYCSNSPMIHTDPNGEFFGLNILIGAAVGAIIGGVVAAATGQDVMAGVVGGAVGGAIAGATFGLGLVVSGMASGAASSFTSTMIQTQGDFGKSLESAVFGGIAGAITGGFASKIVGGGVGKLFTDKITKTAFQAFDSVAIRHTSTEAAIVGGKIVAGDTYTITSVLLKETSKDLAYGVKNLVINTPNGFGKYYIKQTLTKGFWEMANDGRQEGANNML